jgi:hypothetical protein
VQVIKGQFIKNGEILGMCEWQRAIGAVACSVLNLIESQRTFLLGAKSPDLLFIHILYASTGAVKHINQITELFSDLTSHYFTNI